MNGGLRVPRTHGVGDQEGTAIHNRWDTFDRIKKGFEDLGFGPKSEPEFACPILTADKLTTPDSRSYTETYVELLAWWGYAAEKLSSVKAEVLQVANEMDYIEATTRIRMRATPSKKPSKEEVDDQMSLDPRHTELKLRRQELIQMKELLDVRTEEIERSLRVVSRQVEIRRMDLEQHSVSSNMPGRGGRRTFQP